MAIFKCKMCGGSLEIQSGETVATCEYCDTRQTVPQLDDDRRANLYDRANHFRRNNDFDKAMGIYEQILTETGDDAEAYWSLVLCRYGIEYVEDPATHKRIPTVNRVQYTSVFDDDNYKSALQYADDGQRGIYEAEAKAINEIQKGILAISQKEEPFDVFICYKETDSNGRRTPDSVLANDLYHQLTQEGYKVFFSRITLEDKLGTAYEPYIFAALNSAKVMVVLGTRPEYFNAVWVKNEWSRYLALVKQGQKKILVPAYKDMDPYDLPEEFSHLQAQDMGKLGFMQDLIRGIKKMVQIEAAPVAVKETVVSAAPATVAPLLKRAFMFLEDKDWSTADEYAEKVLDIDPECADAYLAKLMAELHVGKREALKECENPFDYINNYQKSIRFGDAALKAELEGAVEHINARNEELRLNGIYDRAMEQMKVAKAEIDYKRAADLFASICEHKDADALANECYQQAEVCRKDTIYNSACSMWLATTGTPQDMIQRLEKGISQFETLDGWKESAEKIEAYTCRVKEIKEQMETDRIAREKRAEEARLASISAAKKQRISATIIWTVLIALVAFLVLLFAVILPNHRYNAAVKMMEEGKYLFAIDAFRAMDGYKDSEDMVLECYYRQGVSEMEEEKYSGAIWYFSNAKAYKDADEKIAECEEELAKIRLENNRETLKNAKAGNVVKFGSYEQDNDPTTGKEDIEWIVLEVKDGKALVVSKYALDCKPYNTSNTDVTWATCSLRVWLNNEFLNTAFADFELAAIPTTRVETAKNEIFATAGGDATGDKVFLLSADEAKKYFSSNTYRLCQATTYAEKQGAYVSGAMSSTGNKCVWWLRTPGSSHLSAAYVDVYGAIDNGGVATDAEDTAVRPVMWIDLSLL